MDAFIDKYRGWIVFAIWWVILILMYSFGRYVGYEAGVQRLTKANTEERALRVQTEDRAASCEKRYEHAAVLWGAQVSMHDDPHIVEFDKFTPPVSEPGWARLDVEEKCGLQEGK